MTDGQSHGETPPRKLQLLDAARTRFVQDGFKATPVSAIVKAAGVAQGTFYLYFSSKQDLLTELQREVVRTYERALRSIAARDEPFDERLARIIVTMAVLVRKQVDLERVFREAGSGEQGRVGAMQGRRRMARHAEDLMRGEAIPGDRRTLARLLVTLFDEVLFETQAYAPEGIEAVVRESLGFTLRGIGVDPVRAQQLVDRCEELTAQAEAEWA